MLNNESNQIYETNTNRPIVIKEMLETGKGLNVFLSID